MTARDEQETTITLGRMDDVAQIWTNDLRHVRALRKLVQERDFVTEVAGGDDWGQFEVRVENFYLLSAIRRKAVVSEEIRAARAAVLAAHREAVAA